MSGPRRHAMQQLNIQDVSLLLMESATSPQHVGGLQILRKPKGAQKDYARRLYQRWVRVPVRTAPFNYRLVETVHDRLTNLAALKLPGVKQLVQTLGTSYFWEILDDVDVAEHLHLHTLPSPGSDAQLLELVSRLHASVLDRSRPLWEQHIIDGLPGDRYAF
jgi:diacylglycerol O-acyltransferase / wax synthase